MGSGTSTQINAIDDKQNKAVGLSRETPSSELKREASNNARSTQAVKSTPETDHVVSPPSTSTAETPIMPLSTARAEADNIRIVELEKELGNSESEKLDLQDRIQALEERIKELTTSAASSKLDVLLEADERMHVEVKAEDLHQTLNAKDNYIQQLEKQMATVQTESNKARIRLKKKIKQLTAQLNEARQESSIAKLEMRDRNNELQEDLRKSQGEKSPAVAGAARIGSGDVDDDMASRMKVILDLSAEVSDQAERIAELERQLRSKDKEIERLKHENLRTQQTSGSLQFSTHNGQGDGRNNHSSKIASRTGLANNRPQNSVFQARQGVTPVESVKRDDQRTSVRYGEGAPSLSHYNAPKNSSQATPSQDVLGKLTLPRQSTVLSDTDSDWELEMPTSKIHSAPPRMRFKSASANENCNNIEDDSHLLLVTDDNELDLGSQVCASRSSSGRQKRRSALEKKQEQERNLHSQRALLGPSLAFVQPVGEQLTDSSCTSTPSATPRNSDSSLNKFSTSAVLSMAI